MNFLQIIKFCFLKIGIDVRKFDSRIQLGMNQAIKRFKLRESNISTIIDIGASDGSWSKICFKYFNESKYLLIEGNNWYESKLKEFSNKNEAIQYVIAVAGDTEGFVYFDGTDITGGVASLKKENSQFLKVNMTSIDSQVEKLNLKPPYFIKLDTHGFEIPILEGAKKTLENTEILLIEVYNFQLTPTSLKFYEMCLYLEKMGFRPIDMADPFLRVKDYSLWQMDLFFMKSNRPEFTSNEYN